MLWVEEEEEEEEGGGRSPSVSTVNGLPNDDLRELNETAKSLLLLLPLHCIILSSDSGGEGTV